MALQSLLGPGAPQKTPPYSSLSPLTSSPPTSYYYDLQCIPLDNVLPSRGELSYLAPLGTENISAPYFKHCFFQGVGGITPQTNTTPPSSKTEITNILFYILNFESIIKFKM